MLIKFSNEHTAQAAANVFERYGYEAFRSGTKLVTDCPTLLAVPVVHRAVGFDRVQEVDLAAGSFDRSLAARPESRSLAS